MNKVIKFFTVIRNNWKKSALGSFAIVYGGNYLKTRYEIEQMMRAYCVAAQKFGDMPLLPGDRSRNVTVILNPAANKRKAKKDFEKYCAPILYLSGMQVDLIETEAESQAREVVTKLSKDTDAIVVAGGDGTLSETVTGVMRSRRDLQVVPLGVLPLGRSNSLAQSLFGCAAGERVRAMADAAMAVVVGVTRDIDAIKIDVIEVENGPEPVYGVVGVWWGAWRDLQAKQDGYWWLGPLRGYAAVLFNSGHRSRPVQGTLGYCPPCSGCSNCREVPVVNTKSTRWWNVFARRPHIDPGRVDYSSVVNEACSQKSELDVSTLDLSLSTMMNREGTPHLQLCLGPESAKLSDFVAEGWRRVGGAKSKPVTTVMAREVEIRPNSKDEETWLSIDNEEFEVRSVRVTLLPNALKVFHLPKQ